MSNEYLDKLVGSAVTGVDYCPEERGGMFPAQLWISTDRGEFVARVQSPINVRVRRDDGRFDQGAVHPGDGDARTWTSTCASCGGNPDAVIRTQREELAKYAKRVLDAEAQLALLHKNNKSLEKCVDWAGAKDAVIAEQERAIHWHALNAVHARTTVLALDAKAIDMEVRAAAAEAAVEKMQPVFDAAMANYRDQDSYEAQGRMFAACARIPPP